METLLNQLCDLFEIELTRQNRILDMCRAQRNAARTDDIEALEANTAGLAGLVRDTAQAEHARHELLRQVVDHLELPVERQTLADLTAAAPEPWRGRLRAFQEHFRATLAATREVVRESARVIRRRLSILEQCMDIFDQCTGGPCRAYNAAGDENRKRNAIPALIDRKG